MLPKIASSGLMPSRLKPRFIVVFTARLEAAPFQSNGAGRIFSGAN